MCYRACLASLLFVALTSSGCDEQAFSQPEDSEETEVAAEFDPAEWEALVQQKAELVQRMQDLEQEYQTADGTQQQQIAARAQELQQRFRREVTPKMVRLAPEALERNPNDPEAALIMMQVNYGNNRFDEAAELADNVLQQQPTQPLALNMGGIAQFALHNFEKSLRLLETAQENDALYPQLGGRFLDSARNYIEYWEAEQEIRRQEAAASGNEQLPQVLMKTDKGEVLLELFENEAPNTVANFISLVESGYYDGIPFHRVIPGFMAQGGKKQDPAEAIDYTIKCECYRDVARRHFTGSISMAHAGRDTGGAQFFITHLPTPHLDEEVQPTHVHTVFGRVVDGMDAVAAIEVGDKIVSAEVVRKRDHEYQPVTQPSDR